MKIHVFDKDKLSRRVLDRTWPNLAAKSAENDPKMAPQDDPKSTQNRCQKMIKMLIENKSVLVIHLGRPGGMRWPPGGIIGGAKNSLFEICRCLRHIRALRFGGLAFGLDIWLSIQHARLRPSGAGGGLTSPRGITAARPPFFILRFGARPLGYVDFGDLKRLRCLLEPLGAILEGLEPS